MNKVLNVVAFVVQLRFMPLAKKFLDAGFLWPCGTEEITMMIKTCLDGLGKKTVFKGNSPGKDWIISFKLCWQDRNMPEKTRSPHKSSSWNPEPGRKLWINFWICFMRFYIVVVSLKMQMQLIAFLILLNQVMQQILTGEKYWSKSCPGIAICWRQHVVRPCTPFLSVVQLLIHSCLLCKGLHLYEPWCQNGSEGTVYINLPLCGGWMTDSILENWFKNQFFTFVSDMKKSVILLFVGHGSHLT